MMSYDIIIVLFIGTNVFNGINGTDCTAGNSHVTILSNHVIYL